MPLDKLQTQVKARVRRKRPEEPLPPGVRDLQVRMVTKLMETLSDAAITRLYFSACDNNDLTEQQFNDLITGMEGDNDHAA